MSGSVAESSITSIFCIRLCFGLFCSGQRYKKQFIFVLWCVKRDLLGILNTWQSEVCIFCVCQCLSGYWQGQSEVVSLSAKAICKSEVQFAPVFGFVGHRRCGCTFWKDGTMFKKDKIWRNMVFCWLCFASLFFRWRGRKVTRKACHDQMETYVGLSLTTCPDFVIVSPKNLHQRV